MKRFTETQKWNETWFRKLPPKLKLLWQWMMDNCDPCGAIEFDTETSSFFIGEEIHEKDLEKFGPRVQKLNNGKVWIVDFVPFQYGELSDECRPHKVVFDALKRNSIQYPINTLSDRVADRAQDKEKDKDKDRKGSAEGKPDNLPTSPRAKLISDIFHRRHTTPWSGKEIEAFKKLKPQPDEDFTLVADFYANSGHEFLRHDLLAFLNNFTGEVDKARKWKAGKLNGSHRQPTGINPRVAGTANANMCDQYRGVGKVKGTSESNGSST